jgi:hypothetical protein
MAPFGSMQVMPRVATISTLYGCRHLAGSMIPILRNGKPAIRYGRGSVRRKDTVTDIEIESQTRVRAYAIWEAEGRPEGRAVDHWLAAEAERQPPVQRRARVSRPRRTSSSAAGGAPVERSARSTTRKAKTAAATGDKR